VRNSYLRRPRHVEQSANPVFQSNTYPEPILAFQGVIYLLLKTWLDMCTKHHTACDEAGDAFVPTRLLDLKQNGASLDLVLIESEALPPRGVPYAALSHCWGTGTSSKPPPVLTTANLSDRRRGIQHSELSLTFQDAVRIARAVGVRYLWIDSLCILQDSNDDWQHESATMCKVYSRAFCTLAASGSRDSSMGCRVTDGPSRANFMDVELGSKRVRFYESGPEPWADEYRRQFLQTRGWCLQERELSPRVIHFCAGQLLWECRQCRASSEVPWFQVPDPYSESSLRCSRVFDLLNKEAMDKLLPVHRKGDRWQDVVEDYASRSLTFSSDRLPALSGLVRTMAGEGRGAYLSGIWGKQLPWVLLWKPKDTPAASETANFRSRGGTYIAPSWSWISLQRPVWPASKPVAYPTGEKGWVGKEARPDEDDVVKSELAATVESVRVVPVRAADPYGELSSAVLCLRGYAVRTVFEQKRDPFFQPRINNTTTLRLRDGTPFGIFHVDLRSDANTSYDVVCLCIQESKKDLYPHSDILKIMSKSEYEDPQTAFVEGLVLVESDSTPHHFVRIGIFRAKQSAFAGRDKISVDII